MIGFILDNLSFIRALFDLPYEIKALISLAFLISFHVFMCRRCVQLYLAARKSLIYITVAPEIGFIDVVAYPQMNIMGLWCSVIIRIRDADSYISLLFCSVVPPTIFSF